MSNSSVPPPPSTPPPWPTSPADVRRPVRWPVHISLTIAVIALGIAIGSWFRPAADTKPTPALSPQIFTAQQIVDAKAKVCATYEKVHQAVLVNTGRAGGSDPTAVLALAANARIALYDGGAYLLNTLAEEPATPPALAAAVRQLASSYQQLAINYMSEAPQSEIDSTLHAGDQPNATIYNICK